MDYAVSTSFLAPAGRQEIKGEHCCEQIDRLPANAHIRFGENLCELIPACAPFVQEPVQKLKVSASVNAFNGGGTRC